MIAIIIIIVIIIVIISRSYCYACIRAGLGGGPRLRLAGGLRGLLGRLREDGVLFGTSLKGTTTTTTTTKHNNKHNENNDDKHTKLA